MVVEWLAYDHEVTAMTNLTVLHHVQLPEPCLVEGVARGMNNMAKSILLREHQHRVQKTFHGFGGLNEGRPMRGSQS